MEDEINILLNVYKRHWQQFNERRSVEIKASFALWFTLLSYIAIVITGRLDIPNRWSAYLVSLSFIVILLLHNFWSYKLHDRNELDKNIAINIGEYLLSKTSYNHPESVKTHINVISKERRKRFDWSRISQMTGTILLCIISIFVTLMKK